MKRIFWLAPALILVPLTAHAVVIRDDVPDCEYVVDDTALASLADLPGEGHGILIAARWVVTVTHTIDGGNIDHVVIGGRERSVDAVFSHPGFVSPPEELAVGDAGPMIAFLKNIHDISLIRLSEPVTDIAPTELYYGDDEAGKVGRLFGKGATGDGRMGESEDSPRRGVLRRAENAIARVEGRWLVYRFECGEDALPLEGVGGSGDSGAPLLVRSGENWQLAGLVDWKSWDGDISTFRDAVCGQEFYNVRMSYYAPWIARTMKDRN